jgi:4-hydroxybenzoate polyprenyltransferase
VINDYADRDMDRHVSRTRNRPLTSGRVTVAETLFIFALLCGAAFVLVLQLNRLTVLLSFVGIGLAVTYPFMKRLTHLPQVHLGAAFGWSVPMAFAAQTNSVPPIAWLMFTATVLWATAYDTIYSMMDRDDDIALGVKSTAILFGDLDRKIIGLIQAMLLVCLLMIGRQAELGLYYYLGVAFAACLAVYQQHLIRFRDRDGCFSAFLNNNWFGAAVFLGILLDYLLA